VQGATQCGREEQVAMSEPSYETALLVATQRNKLAVAQIKSNDSLTPTARRPVFARPTRALGLGASTPLAGNFDDHDLRS
jgi:hypothetical protein